jgi:hypothetical protein
MALASASQTDSDSFELGIATDKVCFVILKARQFDVKEGNADPDSGSNAIDDGMTDVLETKPDDPVYAELVAFIGGLDLDEQLWRWPGSAAARTTSPNGPRRCRRRATSTTTAPRSISSGFRCSATIWKRASPSSAKAARTKTRLSKR